MRRSLVAATLLCAAACSRGQSVPAEPDPSRTTTRHDSAGVAGDTLRVPFAASAVHAASGVRATFLTLVSDSRCATDVTCVWEGDAVIRVRLERAGTARDTTLHWNGRPQLGLHAVTVDGWEVTFFGLTPAPASSSRPADAERVAWLLVKRVAG